jgi:hypothetical protein
LFRISNYIDAKKNDCFKNSFEIKVVDINVILEITVLREALVINNFLIISKLLSWFPRRKITIFLKLMRKGEQKPSHTLPPELSKE